ncbi:MAG: YjjG family noncanonical pyrimidine nucleotidase [Muribaculaceae bacterium]|nr:YjjG family noncanonical pyrimidine nucleotidase [Muribaculaceae bacterium]
MIDYTDIDFIYFDLDDTVWDFSANSPVSLRHVYDFYGFEQYAGSYDAFRDLYLPKNAELWDLYHYGKIDKEFLESERFRHTIAGIGDSRAEDSAFCAAVNEEYLRYLATLPTAVPGAREVLEDLYRKGMPLGILSNGFAGIQQQKLRSAGLLHYFKEIVLSDEVGVTKPLPGIFEFATRKAGTAPHRIMMIGDNYEADIVGAHTQGWKTVYFDRKAAAPNPTVADYTIRNLSELIK